MERPRRALALLVPSVAVATALVALVTAVVLVVGYVAVTAARRALNPAIGMADRVAGRAAADMDRMPAGTAATDLAGRVVSELDATFTEDSGVRALSAEGDTNDGVVVLRVEARTVGAFGSDAYAVRCYRYTFDGDRDTSPKRLRRCPSAAG